MKINSKILSIPPYISTTWKEISSLRVDKGELIVYLLNLSEIRIPINDKALLEKIFACHCKYLEEKTHSKPKTLKETLSFGFPLTNLSKMEDIESLGQAMQHNPHLADSADIPKDILEKIAKVGQALGIEDSNALAKAEPHCNCMYCQVSRAISGQTKESCSQDYEVSDEDLTFRDWDIEQKSDDIYLVKNPLDEKEQYKVHLGNPIGCTCGNKNCEHIRTVLNS